MIPVSIIVPALNEAQSLPSTLARLQGWREQGGEIIVVDGGSSDETLASCHGLCDRVIQSARGRARQMNAGVAIAQGEYLLFLHADTVLPDIDPGVSVAQWQRSSVIWGFFPVRLSASGLCLRVIERAISWRSRLTSVATGDQAIFVKRCSFQQVGGFDDIPLMEDIVLSKALRRLARPQVESAPVVTDSRRWETRGVLRTVLLMWSLRLLFFLGFSAKRLAPWYGVRQAAEAQRQDYCIAQLAKAPLLGGVKTRMQPTLSSSQSLRLHKRLVAHVTASLTAAYRLPVQLWVSEQPRLPLFTALQQEYGLSVNVQQGNDLGERMHAICVSVLQSCQAVILVGSDCPFITAPILDQVIKALDSGSDAVIIPAEDGGYVLMALRYPERRLFTGIDWGTERVYTQTLEKLQALRWRYTSLVPLSDIDRPEDLALLQANALTEYLVDGLVADGLVAEKQNRDTSPQESAVTAG